MKKLQGKVPMILSTLFILSLVVIPIFTFQDMDRYRLGISIAMIGVYLVWLFVEMKIMTVGEIKRDNTNRDMGTTELYGAARLIVVITSLAFAGMEEGLQVRMIAGAVLFVGGIALRLCAIHTLGSFYSHRVRLVEGHKIIDYGPYRFIRHPSYTGMLVAHLGWVIFFANIYCILAYVVLLVPAVVTRILVEEKSLFELDGYQSYAVRRKRLVPLVW